MNIVEVLVRVLAPVLSFTTDEVWEHYPEAIRYARRTSGNVQLAGWPEKSDFSPALPGDADGEAPRRRLRHAPRGARGRDEGARGARGQGLVNKSQERPIYRDGSGSVCSTVSSAYDAAVFEELFIVSSVSFVEGEELARAEVTPTPAEKCPRCWNYRELGGNPNHPSVCERCGDVLDAIGFTRAGSDF